MNKIEPNHEYTFEASALLILIFKHFEEKDRVRKLFDNDKFLTALSYYHHHNDLSMLTEFFMKACHVRKPKKVTYLHKDEKDFVTLVF